MPTAQAQLLIRTEVSKVFNAFIDPEITKEFWFTKASGKLEENKELIWTWEVHNISTKVIATEIIQNQKIKFNWYTADKPTSVTIDFTSLKPDETFVTVVHSGFEQTGNELREVIKDSTSGFTIVLDGLKAYLEYGINLNLIADKYPKGYSK